MNSIHTYRTLENASEGFYKEKGSKFFGFAVPCNSEEQAKELLATWRKEHHQAVHVCYAYRFGSAKTNFRSSDDGEPSNSAGPPILGQIQSFDLTNVLCAVVRYYGGINLGVGGLINAYRTAIKEALENAEIIEKEDVLKFELFFDYPQMPSIMSLVKSGNCIVFKQDFALTCRMEIGIPRSDEHFIAELSKIENLKIENHGIIE